MKTDTQIINESSGMTQTQHLQSVILLIAKDIDALCKKHGIEYFLFGGSALGAKRHKGFIPWDDDLDMVMTPKNYYKFLDLCRTKLDQNKYYVQEGLVDWPEDFSKVKLKGTKIEEVGEWATSDDKKGIFVDVFRLDNSASTTLGRMWQFFCGKLWLAHLMDKKGYKSVGAARKIMTFASKCLYAKNVEKFFRHQYIKHNKKSYTPYYADILGRTRWHNAFIPREVYGTPIYVPFEDTMLPVHQDVHQYLKISFGDYMQLPPVEKRVGLHITDVDFGKY
jgi:lipopolysaccharide cholinephosphotransferase